MVLEPPGVIERVNKALPDQVRCACCGLCVGRSSACRARCDFQHVAVDEW